MLDGARTRRLPCPEAIDLVGTLAPLRHGPYDPTIRFERDGVWLAMRTSAGTATLRLAPAAAWIEATAWGRGAEAALDIAPGIAGLLDDPSALVPRHPIVRDLQRRFAGLRLPRTGSLLAALVPAVIEQKVTSIEAHRTYRLLARRLGEAAPGPGPAGGPLLVPPSAAALAALPYFAFHPLGLERRRAEVLRRLGMLGPSLEELAAAEPADARTRLQAIPGVGPWTAAEASRIAHGDPDAVSVGDAHIPAVVAWALAREPRGNDARMLELLEPYAGQRARVIRLLEAAGVREPRCGPRMPVRSIARL